MVSLSKTDKEIIKLLQEDGRMSFVDMAERIGVTEGTIRRKFYRLVEDGIIEIGAKSDPFVIGFDTPAVIGLNVKPSHVRQVMEEVARLPRVRQLMLTTGMFDIIVVGYFASNQELANFVTEKLAGIEGVTNTNTSVVLEIFRDSFQIGLPDEDPAVAGNRGGVRGAAAAGVSAVEPLNGAGAGAELASSK